jgi:glycosyltransferase involved in cell wall biosynthesis
VKIVYASETYLPTINGAAVFTSKLAEEMAKRGHGVSVITTSTDIKDHAEKIKGVNVYRVRSLSTILKPDQRFSITGRSGIEKIIKTLNPDIVHIQNHFFIGYYALEASAKLGIPVIGTNHVGPGDISAFLPDFMRKISDKIIWNMFAKVYGKCAYLTAPSRFAFSLFSKHGVNLEGKAISNGVDLDQFNASKSGKEPHLKQKYDLPKKPIVLYAGRLDPGKEMEVWIRSIPYVLQQVEAHFVLVGAGVKKKRCQDLVRSLGIKDHVTFINAVPYTEMPDFYRLADIFAISSTIETQGLVVLEAMATALPVIAAGCGALPELVSDGENGFLFDAGNSRMMAEKTARLINNRELAKEMGRKSLQIAQEHSIQNTFDSFEQLYEEVKC